MSTMVVKSRVGIDGVLSFTLPLDPNLAGQDVDITIRPSVKAQTQAEWEAFIERTAGSISDPGFERHPQGEFESRDPF